MISVVQCNDKTCNPQRDCIIATARDRRPCVLNGRGAIRFLQP